MCKGHDENQDEHVAASLSCGPNPVTISFGPPDSFHGTMLDLGCQRKGTNRKDGQAGNEWLAVAPRSSYSPCRGYWLPQLPLPGWRPAPHPHESEFCHQIQTAANQRRQTSAGNCWFGRQTSYEMRVFYLARTQGRPPFTWVAPADICAGRLSGVVGQACHIACSSFHHSNQAL